MAVVRLAALVAGSQHWPVEECGWEECRKNLGRSGNHPTRRRAPADAFPRQACGFGTWEALNMVIGFQTRDYSQIHFFQARGGVRGEKQHLLAPAG